MKIEPKIRKEITIIVFLLLLILVWPIIIWHNDIEFDKIQFINEWLKIVGSGIVLSFIFNYSYSRFNNYSDKIKDQKNIQLIETLLDKIYKLLNDQDDNELYYYWKWIIRAFDNMHTTHMKNKIYIICNTHNFIFMDEYFSRQLYSGDDSYRKDILNRIENFKNKLISQINEN